MNVLGNYHKPLVWEQ